MKISQLPPEIKEKALNYQREASNEWDKKTDSLMFSFNWSSTDEGGNYWDDWDNKPYDLTHQLQQLNQHYPKDLEIDYYNSAFRPKSLKGIENNNGWIKIESESDLPSEDCDCYIEFKDGNIHIDRYFYVEKNFDTYYWKNLVAYIPIPQPKKRIY
jgi:hypothetical protein